MQNTEIIYLIKDQIKRQITNFDDSYLTDQMKDRMNLLNIIDFDEYIYLLNKDINEKSELLKHLNNNYSEFFRNSYTFEYIYEYILPAILFKQENFKNKSFRIWSAGCSSGEEPYSISILLNEFLKSINLNVNVIIYATDIIDNVLYKANEAVYTLDNVKNMKYHYLNEYFTKVKDNIYKLNDSIKKSVIFSKYDMLSAMPVPPNSVFGDFDMIFCRNLIMYYNDNTQDYIFDKITNALNKSGYLILGETEKLSVNYKTQYRELDKKAFIYQKN